ncbi:MAG: response regulator [Eubacteriales bacterium]|nr:response regulator [Eubacteriales bacterium]
MIVDDEVLARIGIKTFLDGKEGISVAECFSDAGEALVYLERTVVDVVITDIEMEGMDGLAFIEKIREKKLAGGIIILSSHNDFQYARKAIELKANQYILKQELTEEVLIEAVLRVQRETAGSFSNADRLPRKEGVERLEESLIAQDSLYYAAALLIPEESGERGGTINKEMLYGLLENLMRRYPFGELFRVGEEMFVLIHFAEEKGEEANHRAQIISLCEDLIENVRLYTNHRISIGLSALFRNLKDVRTQYHRAVAAAQQNFYEEESAEPYYDAECMTKDAPEGHFHTDAFLEEDGEQQFREELENFLKRCGDVNLDIEILRQTLISMISVMVYRILHGYHFPEETVRRWEQKYQYIRVISEAYEKKELVRRLDMVMCELRMELLTQLRMDEFGGVYRYVDEHMNDRISLTELAEMSCMSTAVFCKKFKERTGVTLIEYINARRIDLVKRYLGDPNRSLEEIAEETGFSSANYMVRVFKKVTGETIRDFRKTMGE